MTLEPYRRRRAKGGVRLSGTVFVMYLKGPLLARALLESFLADPFTPDVAAEVGPTVGRL